MKSFRAQFALCISNVKEWKSIVGSYPTARPTSGSGPSSTKMQFIRRRYKAVRRKPLWTLGGTRPVPLECPFLSFRDEGNSTTRSVHGIEGAGQRPTEATDQRPARPLIATAVRLDLMRGAGFEPANPYGTGF